MTANHTISLTCSECLKCKESHLLVRCPRQAASTGRKKKRRMLSQPFKELLPNKIKESYILLFIVAVRICQHNMINTIDNSTGFNTAHERICYWHPRSQHPSFRIKMLTSARKSTPHPGRALTSFESYRVG